MGCRDQVMATYRKGGKYSVSAVRKNNRGDVVPVRFSLVSRSKYIPAGSQRNVPLDNK